MDAEKFFVLMPTESVQEEEVNQKVEEQKGFFKMATDFVSGLSINRFLYKKLTEFDLVERLNFFEMLRIDGFIFKENELFFSDLDIEAFCCILEEKFKLDDENFYQLDNLYIENLLQGKDITNDTIHLWEEVYMDFDEILGQFVFSTDGMSMGDTPPLMKMLIAKKALLASYLAEKNIESLQEGKREIYQISSLF